MRFLNALQLQAGDVIAIEGAPIYLCDPPSGAHRHAFDVMQQLIVAIDRLGCVTHHHLLLDEYSCVERSGIRAKYEHVDMPTPAHIALESDFVQPAQRVLSAIPARAVTRGGLNGNFRRLGSGSQPVLVTDRSKPACALLDSAFQRGKVCDLNIVIHPERMLIDGEVADFRAQQQGVFDVLCAIRGDGQSHASLPWRKGWIHIWLGDSGEVVEVTWRRNKGRGVRAGVLPW